MLAAAKAHDVQITVSSVSVAIANLAQAVGVSSDSVVKVHLVSSSVEPPERPIKGPLKLFNIEPPLPFSCCPACEAQSRLTVPIPDRGLRRSDKHQWCAPFGWEVRSFWGKLIVGMEARSTVR
jgi:hypothetical protein